MLIRKSLKIRRLSNVQYYQLSKYASTKAYSNTLNLPNAGNFKLSMKNIYEHEESIKRAANYDNLYKWQEASRSNANDYILHDGPPYANGDIHIGHMVNKVLKDVCLRYKVLTGHKVNYTPGWDCHGLPIELNAMKAQSKSKNTAAATTNENKVLQTRTIARNFALKYIKSQMASFNKLNVLADWSRVYRTIDNSYMCDEIDLFYELYKKNLIFRDYMPVYWSISSQTALAEFEIEYNDQHVSNAVYVKFDLVDYPNELKSFLKTDDKLSVLIWTTTPWSLPGNKAIAFNEEVEYDLLGIGDRQYYIVAHDLVDDILVKIPGFTSNIRNYGKIGSSRLLAVCTYTNPFLNKTSQFLQSTHVNSKQGTGFVHIAPAFGFDDFKLAVRHQLPTECLINEQGYYIDADANLQQLGLNGKNALDKETHGHIEAILGGALVHKHDYTHSYPYDWRSKKPCMIRASPQWFINTGKLRNRALEALEKVKIRPENFSNSMVSSLNAKTYWCISRQRVWGLPIPCVYNAKDEPQITDSLISNVKRLIGKEGNPDFWWTNKYDKELMANPQTETKSKDILDIWFDSGSSFKNLLGQRQADLYCEGMDQFTGWFQSSLLLSIALNEQSPYKSILVHGFVVDENNQKMSKSLGNVIEPHETLVGNAKKSIPQCGNDCMRFWIVHEYHKSKIQIGSSILSKTFDRLFELRSILRFLIANTNDLQAPMHHLNYSDLYPIDKYALGKLNSQIAQSHAHYDDLSLNRILINYEKFLQNDISSFYIKSVKDRLYCEQPQSLERQSAQYTLMQLLQHSAFILAPILPHLCEDVYANSVLKRLSDDISTLFQNTYSFKTTPEWSNPEIASVFDVVNRLRDVFYSQIPSENESLFEIQIDCDQQLYNLLHKHFGFNSNSLNECFSNSQVKLGILSTSEVSTNNIAYGVDGQQNGVFSLRARKLVDNFSCARCRRYLNTEKDLLCERCETVLKNK